LTAGLSPVELMQQLDALDRRDEERKSVLENTINFSRWIGANPWDFKKNKPFYDPEVGFYPWCPYAEDVAKYLDKPSVGIARPIKPVFVARDHIKTTIAEITLARKALVNPNKSFLILCDSDRKAEARLSRIGAIMKQKKVQETFPDKVQPASGASLRENYTNKIIKMKRRGDDPTFKAFGIKSSTTGEHFNGVVWMDDLVNEDNYQNPEIQKQLWLRMQQVIQNVASPGCDIWISGTRYTMADAYSNVIDEDSALKNNIVPGMIMLGCEKKLPSGRKKSIFYFRFCSYPGEKSKPVMHEGVEFHPIRECLEEKKAATHPVSEYYAQMDNNPISSENATFKQRDFEHTIPVTAAAIQNFIDDPEQVSAGLGISSQNSELLDRGTLDIAVLGDPAHGGHTRNDFSVLMCVAQDMHDHWYMLDGWRGRTGDTDSLRKYFTKALMWRDKYNVTLPFAIETHAKTTNVVMEMVATELGLHFNPDVDLFKLKDNAHVKKEIRIHSLAPVVCAGKLHFCENFPSQLRKDLITEAEQYPNGRTDDILDTLANGRQVFRPRRIKKKNVNIGGWREKAPSRIRRFL